MKSFFAALMLLCLWLTNVVQADYITVTPEEYQNLDIPVWMTGPIWMTFEHDERHYMAVHVFTDEHNDPYILLTKDYTDNLEQDEDCLYDMSLELKTFWYKGWPQSTIKRCDDQMSHRHNDVCMVIPMPDYDSMQRFATSRLEASKCWLNTLSRVTVNDMLLDYDNVQLHIILPRDTPDWMMECLPYELQEGTPNRQPDDFFGLTVNNPTSHDAGFFFLTENQKIILLNEFFEKKPDRQQILRPDHLYNNILLFLQMSLAFESNQDHKLIHQNNQE